MVAGGGTGGVTVFYGEQLNHTNAEVVYVDFSKASMQISQQRARFRKLKNIIWIRSWIEGVRYLGIGLFEQSQCSGVLHHLKSPISGLNILKDLLTVHGGMNLMVYAQIGRKAVYQVQQVLKIMKWSNNIGILKELEIANHTLNALLDDHWFHVSSKIGDHKHGNIGIYDLLLHKRDIAFTISSLWQWIAVGGLHFVDFDYFKTRFRFNIKYYSLDELLRRKILIQPLLKQWSTSELILGEVTTHGFFVSKDSSSEAKLSNPSNRFFLCGNPLGFRESFLNPRNRRELDSKNIYLGTLTSLYLPELSIYNKRQSSAAQNFDVSFAIEINPFSVFLLSSIFKHPHGVVLKSLYSEFKKIANSTYFSEPKMYELAHIFYESIKDTGLILLRDASTPSFPKSSSATIYSVT